MEWLLILGAVGIAHYFEKNSPPQHPTGPVKTIWSVRKAYRNNLHMIDRLPLARDEREAAREAARQKMLRELDELMS